MTRPRTAAPPNSDAPLRRPTPGAIPIGPPAARLLAGGMSGEKSADFWGSGRRLLGLLRPERGLVAVALVLGLGSVTLAVLGPKLLGRATDLIFAGVVGREIPAGVTKEQAVAELRAQDRDTFADMLSAMAVVPGQAIDFARIRQVLLWALAVYVGASVLSLLQARLSTVVVQRAVFRLREQVEAKLSRLPLRYFDTAQRGEVLSRATNDTDNIAQTLQQALSQIITSVLTVVGVLAVMVWISPVLAIIALVSVPLALSVVAVVGRRAQPQFARQWATTGTLNGHIEEMFTGHSVVKAFGRERQAMDTFVEHNEKLYESSYRAQFISGGIQPAMLFIANASYVLVAVVGGLRVASGAISLGDVQAFIQYTRQFSQPIMQMASMASLLQSGVASAERVFALLAEPEQVPDPAPALRPASVRDTGVRPSPDGGRAPARGESGGEVRGAVVVFEDVSFRYVPDQPLIEHVSLSAQPGHTVAIVGPTGAGKTTLVNLLMRFYEVDSGRITLDGVDIATMPRDQLRANIGMVLQDTWLFGGTIADNIAYGADNATRDDVIAAARAAYADRFVRTLPDGYDTVVDEEGATVSAGERQLITIARAFLARPAILILDEATSSVDTRTEVLVQRAMGTLRAGRTSFVIAHRLSTIREAEVIVVMDGGRIVEQGTHSELLTAGGTYARLYAAQFEQATASVE